MSKIIKYNPHEIDDIVKQINKFGIKNIMVVFDEENYLFTDYICDEDMHALLAIENHQNEKMYISNCNCGYGGTGPHNTEHILTYLGIPTELAEKLILYNGFKIPFDKENRAILSEIIYHMPFVSREEREVKDSIFFDKKSMAANLIKKQLYFITPRKKSFISLLKTLDKIEIHKMTFYIGQKNYNYFDFSMPYKMSRFENIKETVIQGPYIQFQAEPFDVICFIGNESPISMINAIYFYLTEKLMFSETIIGSNLLINEIVDMKCNYLKGKEITLFQKIKAIISLFKKTEDIYYSVELKKDKKDV